MDFEPLAAASLWPEQRSLSRPGTLYTRGQQLELRFKPSTVFLQLVHHHDTPKDLFLLLPSIKLQNPLRPTGERFAYFVLFV